MARFASLVVTLLALVLAALCVRHHAERIQGSLIERTTSAVAGISPEIAVSGAGRDLTLAGVVARPADRAAAETSARSVRGVRTLTNLITALPAATFEWRYQHGRVLVRGTVPSEQVERAALAAAAARVGAVRVTDELGVERVGDSWWLQDIGALIGALDAADAGLQTTGFAIEADRLLLRGVTPDPALRATIEAAARAAAPAGERPAAVALDNQLAVVAPQRLLDDMLALAAITCEPGSERLTAGGAALVERVRAVLARSPELHVLVAGHTDDASGPAASHQLSLRRARAVADLLAHTLGAERLRAEGYGAAIPIADNRTEEGRRRNRRIEFRLHPSKENTP